MSERLRLSIRDTAVTIYQMFTGNATTRPINTVRLIGGRSCLDFVNTVHDRFATQPEDYIADGTRYVAWAVRAGLITQAEAHTIAGSGIPRPVLAEARALRDCLHRLLSAKIDRRAPAADEVATLDRWLQRAWRSLRLDMATRGALRWDRRAVDAQLPLKRVALSALDLLQTGEPSRLKRCAKAGECGWLFYDDSRNNLRRWCSMDTCGAPDKMRRYRRRLRGRPSLHLGSQTHESK